MQLAITDQPEADVRSIYSVSEGDVAEEPPPPERPAGAAARDRRQIAVFPAQHPGRDSAVRPLTANERRSLRRTSSQMINCRRWTTSQA